MSKKLTVAVVGATGAVGREMLKTLDQRERDIIILHYYSGQTLKAIAEKLRISYAYVKVLHNKALMEIKNYFEK